MPRLHRSLITALALLVAQALLAPLPAVGEVKLKVREDGVPFIYNEGVAHRSRRLSGRLVRTPQAELIPIIERHARRQQLSTDLVRAVIQVESGYNARARSRKGAMGLMQLMPETARSLAVQDPYDPDQNVRGGTTYLRRMLDRFGGSLELALAAYNAGPGAVEKYRGIPPYRETKNYVNRVLGLTPVADGVDAAASGELRLPRKEAGLASSGTASSGAPKSKSVSKPPAVEPPAKRPKIYITRDPKNRILLTTTPPKGRRK